MLEYLQSLSKEQLIVEVWIEVEFDCPGSLGLGFSLWLVGLVDEFLEGARGAALKAGRAKSEARVCGAIAEGVLAYRLISCMTHLKSRKVELHLLQTKRAVH